MPKKISAGLLMYRIKDSQLEVFLGHPGGPYFRNKDKGYWSIPKGEVEEDGLDLLNVAQREFTEEVGISPTTNEFIPLGHIKRKDGKIIHAWAFAGDWDDSQAIKSNFFEIEWPPRTGQKQKFPEIDRAQFFPVEIAKQKIQSAQIVFIERLEECLKQ